MHFPWVKNPLLLLATSSQLLGEKLSAFRLIFYYLSKFLILLVVTGLLFPNFTLIKRLRGYPGNFSKAPGLPVGEGFP